MSGGNIERNGPLTMSRSKIPVPLRLLILASGCHLIAAHCFDFWYAEVRWLTGDGGGGSASPLYSLLVRGLALLSENEILLRLPSLAACLGAVYLIWRLSVKCLGGDGAVEAGILAAGSPLLLSAGWEVHPCAFDLLAAALWLNAFMILFEGPRLRQWILFAAASMLALSLNIWMAILVLPQPVLLTLDLRRNRVLMVRWLCALLPAAGLAAALLVCSGGTENPESTSTLGDGTFGGYEAGYLMTDISLGRLHSWQPLTPAVTMAPSGFEAPSVQGRTIGSPDEERLPWFLQGMQMLFLGLFSITMVLAIFSVWSIKAYSLIRNVEIKGRKRPGERKLNSVLEKAISFRKRGVLFLLLCVILPPLACLVFPLGLAGFFPEQRLLFIAVPWLVLVGRGMASLEWKVARYSLLLPMIAICLFYLLCSSSLQEALHGCEKAARSVDRERREGDLFAADPLLAPVLDFYTSFDTREPSTGNEKRRRLWEVRYSPPEDSPDARVTGYLASLGLGSEEEKVHPFLSALDDCTGDVSLVGKYEITLWDP